MRYFDRTSVVLALVLLGGSLAAGCGATGPERRGGERYFLTSIDYAASGRAGLERHLAGYGPEEQTAWRELIERCSRATLLVSTRQGSAFTARATGVAIADGRFALTAGHAGASRAPGDTEVSIDGASYPARLEASELRHGSDWAVLRLAEPARAGSAALSTRSLERGELVLVLGFPGSLGHDSSGRIVHLSNAKGVSLEPCVHLARVLDDEGSRFEMVAGAVPSADFSGISGGPVFDRQGELVAILQGASYRTRDGATDVVLVATPVALLAERLLELTAVAAP